jgi:hypothetical protein
MIRPLFAALLALLAVCPPVAAGFRAPTLPAAPAVNLDAPAAKAFAAHSTDDRGRLRVGDVRPIAKAIATPAWQRSGRGFISRLRATSEGAAGLRVKLDLGTMPGAMEVRVQGDRGDVVSMVVDPINGTEAWTPWTEGDSQVVEVFSPVAPAPDAVRIGALLHFTASPVAKAAATCTLSTACTSGDPALDALIAERKKSVMRIQFVQGGGAFVCSATLIDTPQRPVPYILTANHCVDDPGSANSVSAFWFFEQESCEVATPAAGVVQTAGGMQLVFTNFNADSSLLMLREPPPAGALFAPVNAARIVGDVPGVSISHPTGDTSRWADGTVVGEARDADRPYDMYLMQFARGIIQGGSSGSGLFTTANGTLQLRGVLSQGPVDGGCSTAQPFGLYGRMDVFHRQVAQYIGAASTQADDAPNRPQDVAAAITGSPIDTLAQPVTVARRIDYPGDIDLFKFTLASTRYVSAFTSGVQDTVGTFLDANGVALEANDDAQLGSTNTGLTRQLGPGTYYFSVGHWTPEATGAYELTLRADDVDANYTSLWYNAPAESEPGWGININHQGNILFATLFTYDFDGSGMWLVMSRGERQADGSFAGALHRTTGPAFNAVPWGTIGATQVGTMRLRFSGPDVATLSYTYNGVPVTKTITKQNFGIPPTCTWSAFDRSYDVNVQDLWYNAPAESEPGWGLNIAQQGEIAFATLFTYAANGRGLWLVMPRGDPIASGEGFSGPLYRTSGPPFNASPWVPIGFTAVGTMTVTFSNGNAGTLTYTVDGVSVTKQITRQVFSAPLPRCRS